MKIAKPQNIELENLIKIDNLLNMLKDEEEIENITIENKKEEKITCKDITIRKAIINKVEIIESNLEKNTFMDIEFNHCNFSNTSFENSTFIRCEFNNCKLTGCNFIESRIDHVSFIETNMDYSNLSMARMENVLFENTGLRNSSFEENRIKNILLKQADLTQTQFFKTSLKEIDFSDSIIEGIIVSISDIKGAIINPLQALDLIGLMGIKIKE